MEKLLALYFSGTGNTAWAVERLCSRLSAAGIDCKIYSIEDFQQKQATDFNPDTVLIGYPIYGSDMPRIMKEFIVANIRIFGNRDLITLVTQHSFSGDGGRLAARLIKRKKAQLKHIAGIHVNLPTNLSDSTRFIELKNGELNAAKIKKAELKIKNSANMILSGKKVKDGAGLSAWFLGFFTQRFYFRFIEKLLRKKLKINSSLCSYCSKCADCCPMKNIKITGKDIDTYNNCTLCYRCVNLCPQKAISLISANKPSEQYMGIDSA
ncbi:MAG: EFR1 family ferrodoxin [Oscillospiraceae bacterium]|nr:EFR1 family ferrodoxin [Oscillospiraceae bacterium]